MWPQKIPFACCSHIVILICSHQFNIAQRTTSNHKLFFDSYIYCHFTQCLSIGVSLNNAKC